MAGAAACGSKSSPATRLSIVSGKVSLPFPVFVSRNNSTRLVSPAETETVELWRVTLGSSISPTVNAAALDCAEPGTPLMTKLTFAWFEIEVPAAVPAASVCTDSNAPIGRTAMLNFKRLITRTLAARGAINAPQNEPSTGPRLAGPLQREQRSAGVPRGDSSPHLRDPDFPSLREGLRGDPVRGIGLKSACDHRDNRFNST